ncbi:MAG: LacI family transcriptional regulator [Bifidobacteriaceae bacterium]|jgi:LacI family transcriptional regulator|nr:LacI family transcriptional regulator [Bifidobacteriaceae bacterium]
MAERRVSIADVARAAGVSLGTASNVLNRPARVRAETRAKVEAAIAELGFVPHGPARQLRAGVTRAVGLIVLDLANPFYADLARGVEDGLDQVGGTLMMASSQGQTDRQARALEAFESQRLAGVVVAAVDGDLAPMEAMSQRGTPVVLADYPSPLPGLSSVAVDNQAGGELAAQHLLSLGHSEMVMLNGPHSIRQCADRWTGAQRAVAASGTAKLTEVRVDTMDATGGDTAIEAWLAANGRPPQALFCVNDLVAAGAQQALRRAGLLGQGRCAMVGYDDLAIAAGLAVPLTTIRQPARAMGQRAAGLLLAAGAQPVEHVQFLPELVIRESTAGLIPAGRRGSSSTSRRPDRREQP